MAGAGPGKNNFICGKIPTRTAPEWERRIEAILPKGSVNCARGRL